MPDAFRMSGAAVDLSPRVFRDATVDASPAAAAETTIATLSLTPDLGFGLGVLLIGYVAWTVGTAGVSGRFRIRRDSITGTTVKDSGLTTRVAAQLQQDTIVGIDTSPTFPNEVYVLTLIVGSASAESTVSAVEFVAVVI